MSSNLITQPYNIILNPTGGGGRAKPVANGKFYVGETDKDPASNPRTDLAYNDESGTERSLTSPLTLNSSGAFVVSESDGTLIEPYMKDGIGFSVLIEDKNGNPVYSDNHVGESGNMSRAKVLASNSTTPRMLEDRFADGLSNVKDFGVVYEDTESAINNAQIINQMFIDGISAFYFPKGNLWLGDGLNFANKSNIILVGDGAYKTNLRYTDTVTDFGLKIGNHKDSYQSGGGIKGISFWGTYLNNTNDWKTATYRIERMIDAGGWVNRVDISNITINRANIGYYNAKYCFNRTFHGVLIDETSDFGILMGDAGNAVHYSQLMIFRFQGYGGYFNECYGASFDSCSFEGGTSTGDQVSMHIEPFGCSMTGCYFESNKNHLRVACAGWERDPSGNNGIYRSKGFNISGTYFTSANDPTGTTISLICAGGVDISASLIRANLNGVVDDNYCLNNNLSNNEYLEITNKYDLNAFRGNITERGLQKNETIKTLPEWQMYNKDRSGTVSSIFKYQSTLNNSSQVSINRNPNSYRTWLSAQTGSEGGVLPVTSRSGDSGTPNLGSSSFRWDTIYSNNNINTSDSRLKVKVEKIPESLCNAAMEIELVRFKMKDSVSKKGKDSARWHYGVIAQNANDIFEKHGVDLATNGIIGYENLDEAVTLEDGTVMSDIYMIRYTYFQVVLLQAMKLKIKSL